MKPPLLILGATGCIGRGLVAATVAAQRPLIAVARDQAALRQLQDDHADADIRLLPGSVASDAQGARLAKALRKLGRPLGGVVVAIGGGDGRGRLLDQPAALLRRTLDADLLPHLIAARHLLPLLAAGDRGGGYVLVGGPGGEQPWAGYGGRSVNVAALRMLARVLHDEARAHGVRVQLLLVDSPVRTDANCGHACPQWPNAVTIGEWALDLVEPGQSAEPAQAVVIRRAYTTSQSPRAQSASTHAATASAQPTIAQDPDSPVDDGTQHSLQDARALLKALISPKQNEASPR